MRNFQQIVESKMSPSVGDFLQSKIHEGFTVAADKLAQLGILNVEERIAVSSCIGDALQTFRDQLQEKAPTAANSAIPEEVLMQLTFGD
jgi:hypothetical protein